jgi:large subunit ribosomal protein L21
MFAYIESGSHQYRVSSGDLLIIDFINEAKVGDPVTFDRVLLANGGGTSLIGQPTISGASVVAEVVEPIVKGPKLEIQKMRRRKNYRRHTGHRQGYTQVKITNVNIPGLQVVEASAPAAATA